VGRQGGERGEHIRVCLLLGEGRGGLPTSAAANPVWPAYVAKTSVPGEPYVSEASTTISSAPSSARKIVFTLHVERVWAVW
jgi:hypothetical protein